MHFTLNIVENYHKILFINFDLFNLFDLSLDIFTLILIVSTRIELKCESRGNTGTIDPGFVNVSRCSQFL